MFVRAITHHPLKLRSPNLDYRFLRWLTLTFVFRFNFKIKIYPFWASEIVRAISHHQMKSRFTNLDIKCILSPLKFYWFWDLLSLIFSFIFNFKPVFYQTLCLLFIRIVLYILSEAIASECSTSHMASHIHWFPCTQTGFRHGPWNSLLLYLSETIRVQQASTRRLALDFTSCYWFFPIIYASHVEILYANIRQSQKQQ